MLPQVLIVTNQATLGRPGIAQGSFPLAFRPEFQAAAILINELDAGLFESALDHVERRAYRHRLFVLEVSDGDDPNPCGSGKIILRPVEKASGGSAL
jgi:hypothetical protein